MSERYYTYRLFDFLKELAANNDRPWFHARKEEFDDLRAHWLDDLRRLVAAIAQFWPETARLTPADCAYRIYRDIRFSRDKSPYKTFFSAAVCPQGKSAPRPGFYLHMAPDGLDAPGSGLYGGLWCPPSADLRKLRRAIVDNIEEWEEIVNAPEVTALYPGWCGQSLKRVPQGWPADHPQAEILKLKEYGKFRPLDEKFFHDPQWPVKAAELLQPLKPLIDFLAYSLDEEI